MVSRLSGCKVMWQTQQAVEIETANNVNADATDSANKGELVVPKRRSLDVRVPV